MEMVRRAMAMGKGELLMWTYNKALEYPINIKCPNPRLAKFIISQYGGPDRRTCSITKIFKPKIWNARPKSKGDFK